MKIGRTNVKRWRNGNMIQRWMAAGLLSAEERFRRIKGFKELPILQAAIRRLTVERVQEEATERKIA